jgi:hypothetical protein
MSQHHRRLKTSSQRCWCSRQTGRVSERHCLLEQLLINRYLTPKLAKGRRIHMVKSLFYGANLSEKGTQLIVAHEWLFVIVNARFELM